MTRRAVGIFALSILLCAGSAQAGVYQDIWTALDYVATPSGFPVVTTSDGTRVNGSRSGRLRIVPTTLGQGYELQFDRTFGVDSHGRPETLHLGGGAQLELAGTTQMTLGCSGKENFRTINGSAAVNNLNYNLSTKLGVQDAEVTGVLGGFAVFDVNPLGFYNIRFDGSNTTSTLTLDGLVVRDTEDLNFDFGPVNVSGNIFFDGAVALLTSLGVDTSGLEGIFPKSPIDQIDQAIRDQIQQGLTLGTLTVAPDGTLDSATSTADLTGAELNQPSAIPEPGTLLIIALGGSTIWYWHRRR